MPKAKNKLSPQEQRKRFEAEVRARVKDGSLSPIDADAALDNLVRRAATPVHSGEPPPHPGTEHPKTGRAARSEKT
jgi:hypothetical protein